MNILNVFTKDEENILDKINIKIENRDYSIVEIQELIKNIYTRGYIDTKITYAEAEKYLNIYERLKWIIKIDIEKVSKYSRKEFENDYYLSTVKMHQVVWNNPERINTFRENAEKPPLTKEEYDSYQKKCKKSSKEFEEYMEYLRDKYGEDLDAVDKYYNTIK